MAAEFRKEDEPLLREESGLPQEEHEESHAADAETTALEQQYGAFMSSLGSTFATAERDNNSNNSYYSHVSETKKNIVFAIFLALFFIGAALFSVPAPFFPNRAMEKGLSQTTAGLILGAMQIIQFFSAIIFAMTMFRFGLKFMLCFGIFWTSICSILFGLLDLITDNTMYATAGFVIRLAQGVGVSAYFVSCSTITAILFADNFALTLGMLNTCCSFGCLIGPAIGGALYGLGGYICPFAVMGGLLMAFTPLIAYVVPNDSPSGSSARCYLESPWRTFKIMMSPSLMGLYYTMLVATMTNVFTETTLGVRLAQLGITNPFVVGAIYLSTAGGYGLAAPLAGRVADKLDAGWAAMFLGTFLSIVGYIILGPSPMLGRTMKPHVVQLIVGSFIAHAGIGSCLIPTSREMQRLAMAKGLDKENPSTFAFISALFDSSWGMGGFLGAFTAGALMEHLGFATATSIQALVMVPSIFMQVFLIAKFGHVSLIVDKYRKVSAPNN